MAEWQLARFFWRVVDDFDHLVMLARLRIADAMSAPDRAQPDDPARWRERADDKGHNSGSRDRRPDV